MAPAEGSSGKHDRPRKSFYVAGASVLVFFVNLCANKGGPIRDPAVVFTTPGGSRSYGDKSAGVLVRQQSHRNVLVGSRPAQITLSPSASNLFGWGASCAASVLAAAFARRRPRSRRCPRQFHAQVSTDAQLVLNVEGLHAESADDDKKLILKGVDITVRAGEVHAIMGQNGSGKSTLAKVLAGDPSYTVTRGKVDFSGQDLLKMEPNERSLAGVFLAFQSPPTVPGVSSLDFLQAIYNAQRRAKQESEADVLEFYAIATKKLAELNVNPDFLNRSVNDGFSGGERKRNEMIQMSILEPKLAILDEIDSGLDIDALKDVADAIAAARKADPERSLVVVTHFERFLHYLDADYVHVMHQGRIIKSGGRELANKLDAEGYDWVFREAGL